MQRETKKETQGKCQSLEARFKKQNLKGNKGTTAEIARRNK